VNIIWGIVALTNFIGLLCAGDGPADRSGRRDVASAQTAPVRPKRVLAVFPAALHAVWDVFSGMVGILSLVFYHDGRQRVLREGGHLVVTPAQCRPAFAGRGRLS
jgi:hypothetical protein